MDCEHKKFVPLSFKRCDFERRLKNQWGNNFPTIRTARDKRTFYHVE
jgi:hypothetical protein